MNTLLAALILTAPQTMCLDAIRPSLKDPESARVEAVHPGLKPGEINMLVNAKNSYGAYAGAKPYVCTLSPDGKRVVDIRSF